MKGGQAPSRVRIPSPALPINNRLNKLENMTDPVTISIKRNKKNSAVHISCKGCQNNCYRNPHLTPVLLPLEEKKFKRQSVSIKTPFREMFTLKKENGKCIFLDVATMRCKAYQKRPIECQLYPFLLYFAKGVSVKLDKRFCPNLDSLIFKKRPIVAFVKKLYFPDDWIRGYETLMDF